MLCKNSCLITEAAKRISYLVKSYLHLVVNDKKSRAGRFHSVSGCTQQNPAFSSLNGNTSDYIELIEFISSTEMCVIGYKPQGVKSNLLQLGKSK